MNSNKLFEKTLNRISIDLDNYKSVPKVLLKAISLFGKENVKLFLSPSGTGFRIEIYGKFSPIENIYYRCLLDDDPYRLRFALMRYLATFDEDVLDVSFYQKIALSRYNNITKEIPLDFITEDDIKLYNQDPLNKELYDKILKKITEFITELNLYTIVIPSKEEYINILKENEKKFKLLVDPYNEDRLIFYQVSSEDVETKLNKFKRYGIPVLHYRVKKIKSKNIEVEGSDD